MATEAFGTSPCGLGMAKRELWSLTPRQYVARRKVWEDSRDLELTKFAQLRADIHNSSEMLQRKDKRRWEAADFGAKQDAAKWKHPRNTLSPEELQRRLMMTFGEEGDAQGRHGPRKLHAVERLKATEQRYDPIPFKREA